MLQSIRHLAQSWIVKGLMLLLMVSFSIWGIGDIFRGNPLQKTVAKVGNSEISVQELNHLFEETLTRARQGSNVSLTAQQAKELGLLDKTLDNAIKRDLVDQDINRLGIAVGPKSVLQLIAEQPQFHNKDGSFNKEAFRQLLIQQHLTEQGLLQQGAQDMARQVLIGALSGSHIIPQAEIDAVYQARAQKRILDVITIDASKMNGIATPDDKTLHDFYAKNPELFTAPEYRSITIASLSTDTIAKDTSISDDELKKEYDTKLDQLAQPEHRDVLQTVVQDEEKAKDLAKQARATHNLSTAAKEAKENAIPLDQLEEKTLMPELSKVVFAMHEGDVSDPIKTQLGWHVIQLTKITPAGTPTFDKIKDQLREEMRRDRAEESATATVNKLDDQLAAGRSLDDIADGLRLRLIKIPAIDSTGLTPEGKAPSELPNKEQTLKDAFAQNSGETSPISDDKNGNYFVVRTDEITPSAPKPYDAVKTTIAAAWKAHEQAVKSIALAEKIGKALQDGKPASAFADEDGVSVRVSSPLSEMGDTDSQLPPDIIAKAFKIKKGETINGAKDNKQIVVRLASITDIDLSKTDPRKGMIDINIKKDTSDELLDQYLHHLYDVFPVTTNAALLDRIRQEN